MDEIIIKSFMELGTTGAFLVYLYIKNGRAEKIQLKMSESIDRNTKVLIKVAMKHRLLDEADELIEK